MSDLEISQKRAWRWYKMWRKTPTYCPALNAKIYKSLRGWWHIKATRATIKRPAIDLIRRYELLPFAEEVIEKGKLVETRNQHDQVLHALEAVVEEDWIRVILVEDKVGRISFLSVLSVNDKKRQRLSLCSNTNA